KEAPPANLPMIHAQGAAWWPLAMARELDDAILLLRTNEPELGTWVLKTAGDAAHVLAADAALDTHQADWCVRETSGVRRRAAGGHLAHALCADRARLMLRRHAARAGPRRRSELHARVAG